MLPMQPYTIRTEIRFVLGEMFPFNNSTLIFDAFVEHGETSDRLVIFHDIRGVLDLVKSHGLVDAPESFDTKENQYVFWGEVLSRVRVEWAHADLTSGNDIRLTYPDGDGGVVELTQWAMPTRLDSVFKRAWVFETALV